MGYQTYGGPGTMVARECTLSALCRFLRGLERWVLPQPYSLGLGYPKIFKGILLLQEWKFSSSYKLNKNIETFAEVCRDNLWRMYVLLYDFLYILIASAIWVYNLYDKISLNPWECHKESNFSGHCTAYDLSRLLGTVTLQCFLKLLLDIIFNSCKVVRSHLNEDAVILLLPNDKFDVYLMMMNLVVLYTGM